MCVHVCAGTCGVNVCVHVCVGTCGVNGEYPPQLFSVFFCSSRYSLNLNLTNLIRLAGWPISSRNPHLCLPITQIKGTDNRCPPQGPTVCVGAGDLNSGLHA